MKNCVLIKQSKPVDIAFLQELSNFLDEPSTAGQRTCSTMHCMSATSGKESGRSANLQWWAISFGQYPNLAINYLAIPATSVLSERLFSKTGLIISERRSVLTPQHAEQVAFLSYFFNKCLDYIAIYRLHLLPQLLFPLLRTKLASCLM